MDARYYQPFVTALTQVGVAIMRAEPTTATINAQWVALTELPGDRVLAALARGLGEWTQFPAPADIKRMAALISREAREREEARQQARSLKAKCSRYAFLLAQLCDPDVPEEKKERIRSEWHEKNPSRRPPWEEDQCQQKSQ